VLPVLAPRWVLVGLSCCYYCYPLGPLATSRNWPVTAAPDGHQQLDFLVEKRGRAAAPYLSAVVVAAAAAVPADSVDSAEASGGWSVQQTPTAAAHAPGADLARTCRILPGLQPALGTHLGRYQSVLATVVVVAAAAAAAVGVVVVVGAAAAAAQDYTSQGREV